MGGFERLSPALQYQIVNTLGFASLRPVQEKTIDAVLDGDDCVVLAPTAGGKTEAAFFPLVSMMSEEDWRPTSVLYLSPIRALLNNQEDRVQRLTGLVGRRAFKWHGDVGDSDRLRFLDEPADVLLTTPESLEAMLMSPRVPAREVFAGLRAVVIDEVHAFAGDDRGAHLAAVLERLSRYAGRELQRVGLSATVGNPAEILAWLGGGSARRGRIVDPGGARTPPKIDLDYVGTMENAATVIEALHRRKKRLIFVDSRRGAEELGGHLAALGVTTFVTHGSLAAHVRADAERAFAEGENCAIVSTSALELGIDVGDLDHVLQIDAPATVASFLQRMGRTGRRAGAVPNCTFLATSEQRLLQAMALVNLYDAGYVEPVRPSRRAVHILAHQLMSLGIQMSGVGRADWWSWLEGATPFEGLSTGERGAVLEHMLAKGILADFEGKLWLGEAGEKTFGRANFRALYAVFETPRLISVRHAAHEIGTIDSTFLASIQEPGELGTFVLGGRTWQVLDIDWPRGRCAVKPAEAGRAARWSGGARQLGYELCQAMRAILVSQDDDARWSKRARAVVATLRAENHFLALGDEFVPKGTSELTWHNYAGGAANLLLARVLERELGGKIVSRNTSMTFKGDAAKSTVGVRQAIEKLEAENRPSWRDALRFAPDLTQSRISKFLPCLPDDLARELLVEKLVDLTTARKLVGLPPLAPDERDVPEAVTLRRPVVWVREAGELAALATRLLPEPFVALDVETTLADHRLCLVQVGTRETNYLIDPLIIGDLSALGRVLNSTDVVKVIHNAAFEKAVLGELGFVIENVYDTLVESRRRFGQVAGGHSLLAVARRELDRPLDKRNQTSDWTRRPLSPEQAEYAALDVEVLVDVYEAFVASRAHVAERTLKDAPEGPGQNTNGGPAKPESRPGGPKE
ncbi:MAG: DEAD/DEAH box helicase [Deltaproteobacteria bacterium]|nr:DEAD/DEAH box helicase [Deltaproteobacteria bacterium]